MVETSFTSKRAQTSERSSAISPRLLVVLRAFFPIYTIATKCMIPRPWKAEHSSCSCAIGTPPRSRSERSVGQVTVGRELAVDTAVAWGNVHPIWPGNRRVHSRKKATLPRKLQMTADKIPTWLRKYSGRMDGWMDQLNKCIDGGWTEG